MSKMEEINELSVLISLFNFDEILANDEAVHQFRDDRGFSLLMLAAEAGRLDVVQVLIDRGEEVNFKVDDESAASLAFAKDHHEIVLTLLNANSKFPSNFDYEKASNKLKAFADMSNEMHQILIEKSEENIKNFLTPFIEANPTLNYFYNLDNVSLLKRAILCKKFNVYEFLLSSNIFLAPHESMDKVNQNLTDDEREELSEINFKVSPNLMTEPMMILMRNCKLGPDSLKEKEAEFMYFIRKAFGYLFGIEEIAIVLKLIAAFRDFKIIFDFNRDSVTFLDPRSEPFMNGKFYSCGKVYIGAKDMFSTRWMETVGVIAHELTHFAMFLCYDNFAKPYRKKDDGTEAWFARISKECRRKRKGEPLIELVYKLYEKNMQHAELIVRVPHMLALYSDDSQILNEKRKKFSILFDFYEQVCMADMEARLPRIERKSCPVRQVERRVRREKTWLCIFMSLILIAVAFGTFCLMKFKSNEK